MSAILHIFETEEWQNLSREDTKYLVCAIINFRDEYNILFTRSVFVDDRILFLNLNLRNRSNMKLRNFVI